MIITTPVQKANLPPTENRIRLVTAIALVFLIFVLSTFLANRVIPFFGELIDNNSFAQKNFFLKTFMLVLTLLAMVVLYRIKKLSYGFQKGKNMDYPKFTKQAALLALLGVFCVILFSGISFAITKTKPVSFPDEHIIARILFIWLWSSIVEEILLRGLFQSLVSPLTNAVFTFRKATISVAVLLSAAAFSAMHLSLIFHGFSVLFVFGILINTFLLGLLAGYLREKTGSIYPAIYVHIIFNVVGSTPLLIKLLIEK